MAKRFTSTGKWDKPWFRKLTPEMKCFWQYLTDSCDHAGIWDVDFDLASFFIGVELDEAAIRREFSKQFIELHDGKKWFVKDFIEFQYGTLNPANRTHASVLSLLEKEGVSLELASPFLALKEKDTDKDKETLKPTASLEYLRAIPQEDLVALSTKYKVSVAGVKSKATDLLLYCEAGNHRYKNYKAFLEGALRKDADKIRVKYPLPVAPQPFVPEKRVPLTPAQEKRIAEMRKDMTLIAAGKRIPA